MSSIFTSDDLFRQGAPEEDKQGAGDERAAPLAERLRPDSLASVVGQEHLLGPDGTITHMLDHKSIASLILWGPPGVGKTTIARLIAKRTGFVFTQISAVFSGVADLKRVFEEAARRHRAGVRTLLFIDEIHRFNRAQQDGFLPVIENGTIVLIGATTENPSFELNGALLSRCQVLLLRRLDDAALEHLLQHAEAVVGKALALTLTARAAMRAMADGDGRALLNMAEQVFALASAVELCPDDLGRLVARRSALYDRNREEHYNLISALHKSMRGSDVDAALYWLARMFAGGEDVRYIVRRLTRFAVEDIGLADPHALSIALVSWQAYERLGSPEGDLAIAQAVIYLATAPKSNAAYRAFDAARLAARDFGSLGPPLQILNAPTQLMKKLGYGAGYEYDHDHADSFSGQNYFPDAMPRAAFYEPKATGFEAELCRRLEHWQKLRSARS